MEFQNRIHQALQTARGSASSPQRIVLERTGEAVVSVYCLLPGQRVDTHIHPRGQDTWVVLSGAADYLAGAGKTVHLSAGEIAIAAPGEIHGAHNHGPEKFVFVSIVSPADAGFEAAD